MQKLSWCSCALCVHALIWPLYVMPRTLDLTPLPPPPPPHTHIPLLPLTPSPRLPPSHASVGVGTSTETVVNLDIRKSFELLPQDFTIKNAAEWRSAILDPILEHVSTKLELQGWQVGAEIYKLLVYEEGSFFAKHRDNERISDMWGTLVVQLPSKYMGAALSVHSPAFLGDAVTYDYSTPAAFTEGDSLPSRTRGETKAQEDLKAVGKEEVDRISFAAFYGDCYHQVQPLEEGSRVVLVYNLTAVPDHAVPFKVADTLPQPAGEELLGRIVDQLRRWSTEVDADYSHQYVEKIREWQLPSAKDVYVRDHPEVKQRALETAKDELKDKPALNNHNRRWEEEKRSNELLSEAFKALPEEIRSEYTVKAKYPWKIVDAEHKVPTKLVAVLSHFCKNSPSECGVCSAPRCFPHTCATLPIIEI